MLPVGRVPRLLAAKKIPSIRRRRALASLLLGCVFGPGATLAPDRFTDQPDYATAFRSYESEPRVRVLFDSRGAVADARVLDHGTVVPLARHDRDHWYLGDDGTLTDAAPSATVPIASSTTRVRSRGP